MAVPTTALAVVAGAGVAGVVASCVLTRTDGVREQGGSRSSGGHFLVPTNKDTARATFDDDRSTGRQLAVGGAALAIGGLVVPHARAGFAALGAGLFAAGATTLIRLHGAEDRLPDELPEHAAPGVPDEYRVNDPDDVRVGTLPPSMRAPSPVITPPTPTWTALGLDLLPVPETRIDPPLPTGVAG